MIPFDFVYCRPNSLSEAYQAFVQLQREGKQPMYYAGGSEIITMSRAGSIQPGDVIDIKQIPECTLLTTDSEGLHIGAACTLSQIKESKLYPLLSLTCGRIADHTNQCRITLGGNLCGTIIYRETSLPLMLSDAIVTLLGEQGLRSVAFQDVFAGRIKRSPEEMIVRVLIPAWALNAPYYHVKKTSNEKIDYPLVSMAALQANSGWRLAFSGVCSAPFRSAAMEEAFNDQSLTHEQRIEKAVQLLPEPAYNDVEGSGEYRTFVFQNTLGTLLEEVSNG